VHTECYEHDEVTVNSWHVYVPLGHLAERTRENQRQWLVRTFPVARNKMKYIVAKMYVKINYSMTPFALDIRKWDASGLSQSILLHFYSPWTSHLSYIQLRKRGNEVSLNKVKHWVTIYPLHKKGSPVLSVLWHQVYWDGDSPTMVSTYDRYVAWIIGIRFP